MWDTTADAFRLFAVRENQVATPIEDILGIAPLSRAIEHGAVRTVDGLAAFFGALCMPAVDEVGQLLKDHVTGFRRVQLSRIAQKTEAKIARSQRPAQGACDPRLIRDVIEEASWSDDDSVQEMWAGLLSSASTGQGSADALLYTDVLKRLAPFQVRLLNLIYSDPRACSMGDTPVRIHDDSVYTPRNMLRFAAAEVLSQYPGDLGAFVNIQGATHESVLATEDDHILALGRFRPQIDALVALGLLRSARLHAATRSYAFLPTLKGLDLYMRGLGYCVYPLEAFIITLRHWCELKGVCPETYRAVWDYRNPE